MSPCAPVAAQPCKRCLSSRVSPLRIASMSVLGASSQGRSFHPLPCRHHKISARLSRMCPRSARDSARPSPGMASSCTCGLCRCACVPKCCASGQFDHEDIVASQRRKACVSEASWLCCHLRALELRWWLAVAWLHPPGLHWRTRVLGGWYPRRALSSWEWAALILCLFLVFIFEEFV